MPDRYVTLSEVKETLEKEQGRRELSQEQKYALVHAQTFGRLEGKKARKMVDDLVGTKLLDEANAVKVADVLPQSADELRALLAKDKITLEAGQTEQLLEIVRKYI
ncbi:MAG: RNA polymerase [Euryarchaeota archaeon]|nr:RNA polymerase [Euryarchaeota archaeon]